MVDTDPAGEHTRPGRIRYGRMTTAASRPSTASARKRGAIVAEHDFRPICKRISEA